MCNAPDCEKYSTCLGTCSKKENRNNKDKNTCSEYKPRERDADGILVDFRCEHLGNDCSFEECPYVEKMKRGYYFDCESY